MEGIKLIDQFLNEKLSTSTLTSALTLMIYRGGDENKV